MSWQNRCFVLLALIGVITAPLVTAHPVTQHLLAEGGHRLPRELEDGVVLALLMLVGASLVPLGNLALQARRWLPALVAARALRASSEPRVDGGIAYRLLPVDGVVFMTTGVLRPHIYASSGAQKLLAPEAFRAALLHEREHQRRRHATWRMALTALDRAFRPLPVVRRGLDGMALECELAADRAALAAGARPVHLFDAIVAANGGLTGPSGIGLATTGTLQRLAILAEPGAPRHKTRGHLLIWPIAVLGIFPAAAHALFWLGAVCL